MATATHLLGTLLQKTSSQFLVNGRAIKIWSGGLLNLSPFFQACLDARSPRSRIDLS